MNSRQDYSHFMTFLESCERRGILREGLIAASIIHLKISLDSLFEEYKSSQILQDVFSAENFGILGQVRIVVDYLADKEVYKKFLKESKLELIQDSANDIFSKYKGRKVYIDSGSFEPTYFRNLQEEIIKYFEVKNSFKRESKDLFNLYHYHFKQFHFQYESKIRYINGNKSLPIKEIENEDYEEKMETLSKSFKENLSLILHEHSYWSLSSFENYCKFKIDPFLTITKDRKIIFQEDKESELNDVLSRKAEEIRTLLEFEMKIQFHPKYDLDIVLGAGFKTLGILEKDYYYSAFLLMTNVDYVFYHLRYKIIFEKLETSFGQIKYFHLSFLDELDFCKNPTEKIKIGFVIFDKPVHSKFLEEFDESGITLSKTKSLLHTESVGDFKGKSKKQLFTFSSNKTLYVNCKNPLPKKCDLIDKLSNLDYTSVYYREQKLAIGIIDTENSLIKNKFREIFEILQPRRFTTNNVIYQNDFIKHKLERYLKKKFHSHIKAYGKNWVILGPEEKLHEIEAYLEKYDSGQCPTYKILDKFDNTILLKEFLILFQRDMNQMMDVATNWEDLSLIVMKRDDGNYSSHIKTLLSKGPNDASQDIMEHRNNDSECDKCFEKTTRSLCNLKFCQHIFCDKCWVSIIRESFDSNTSGITCCICDASFPISYILSRAPTNETTNEYMILVERSFEKYLANENCPIAECQSNVCNGLVMKATNTCLQCKKKYEKKSSKLTMFQDYYFLANDQRPVCPSCEVSADKSTACQAIHCSNCLSYFCVDCQVCIKS